MNIVLTTTENQNNNKKNNNHITTINLGECENKIYQKKNP